MPNSIGKLKKLKELRITTNKFDGTIPTSLSSLTALTRLNLDYNKLSGTVSVLNISKLSKLKYLNLAHNKFTGEIKAIFKLTKLHDLYLAGNNFTGSIDNFSELNELREFSIRENCFAPTNFSQLNLNKATLPKLRRFRLQNSGIQYTIPEVLKAFPNFKNSSDGYSEVFECT